MTIVRMPEGIKAELGYQLVVPAMKARWFRGQAALRASLGGDRG